MNVQVCVRSNNLGYAVFTVMLVLLFLPQAYTQCGSFITTFPYDEDFETSSAWTTGGANSDWTWGTPNHPLISSAPSGTKAWCVGGLNGSSYNASQTSYLLSPCFDFTALAYPWISFDVFWETEYKWDGAVLQYSLDGGTFWSNVGGYNDPVDCLNENWYNYDKVSWLTLASPKHGWSGRIDPTSGSCEGGNGSTMWLKAKHCMSNLAGQANVRFRFLFGSGNSCNDFDGFAIDHIVIQNAPTNTADFSFACSSGTNVNFTNLSSACSSSYLWDFGDPTSGADNTSAVVDPSHTFSAPGSYTVTLTVSGSCNAPAVVTKNVVLISSTTSTVDVSCNGESDGSATVNVSGTGTINYTWNTNPVQTTATASGLAAGTYTVTFSDASGCPTTANITINEPDPLSLLATQDASCADLCNGSLALLASGGTIPYNYSWNDFGNVQQVNGSVCAGTYSGAVTDANGCEANQSVSVGSNPNPDLQCDAATICLGGTANLVASGASQYSWSPPDFLNTDSGAEVLASPLESSIYTLTGISAAGCSSSINVLVSVNNVSAPNALFSYSPQQADVLNPEIDFTNLTEGNNNYTWYFGSVDSTQQTNPSFVFPDDTGASYLVCLEARNNLSCSDTYCQVINIEGISSVFIPNSFSPNDDGINDLFFPVLYDVEESDFLFSIYNRWGEVVFSSSDTKIPWNGLYKGRICPPDTYVWKIQYTEKSTDLEKKQQGHVLLIE